MSLQTYKLTDNDVLYFLHITKTAGTTFTKLIRSYFAPDESHDPQFIDAYLKLPNEVKDKYRFVAGHFFYNVAPVLKRNPVYITMLRDPVERTISYYSGIRRMPPHYAHERAKSQTLLEFVRDERNLPLYANIQTRYIGLDPDILEMARELEANPVPAPLYKDYPVLELFRQLEYFAPNGYNDAAMLERAQERLAKMAFVGLAESFEQSIQLLCYTFGWELPKEYQILNVSTNRPSNHDIPQEAVDIIQENTQLDAELYKAARELFESRCRELIPYLPNQNTVVEIQSLSNLEQKIAIQEAIIEQLQKEKVIYEKHMEQFVDQSGQIIALNKEIERLSSKIENSFARRFTLSMTALRRKLIPEGSTREAVYLKIWGQ